MTGLMGDKQLGFADDEQTTAKQRTKCETFLVVSKQQFSIQKTQLLRVIKNCCTVTVLAALTTLCSAHRPLRLTS